LEKDIVTVGILAVGTLKVDILTVGILTVGILEVDLRAYYRRVNELCVCVYVCARESAE
jgi:uncharacterized membrane protein YiaA